MRTRHRRYSMVVAALLLLTIVTVVSARVGIQTTGICGGTSVTIPFTDVPPSQTFFCSIASAFFSGLTNGTTATTYAPLQPVTREQMAAFVSRTLDQSLTRNSRRAALGQWWTSRIPAEHGTTNVGNAPQFLTSDGEHVYVTNTLTGNLTKVQASTGAFLGTAPIAPDGDLNRPQGVLVAAGYIWIVGTNSFNNDARLQRRALNDLDFAGEAGLGQSLFPLSLTFDGFDLWTSNFGTGPNTGSITRVAIANFPLAAPATFTAGFNRPFGILFDGQWLWVTDQGDHTLKRVDPATGAVVQTVPVGNLPGHPTFDGTNVWVPAQQAPQVVVVRAVGPLVGTVVASYSVQFGFLAAAFDGEHVLMTNFQLDRVALWKATDLTSLGHFPMPVGSGPTGVCSDGVKFWVTLQLVDQIVSF